MKQQKQNLKQVEEDPHLAVKAPEKEEKKRETRKVVHKSEEVVVDSTKAIGAKMKSSVFIPVDPSNNRNIMDL